MVTLMVDDLRQERRGAKPSSNRHRILLREGSYLHMVNLAGLSAAVCVGNCGARRLVVRRTRLVGLWDNRQRSSSRVPKHPHHTGEDHTHTEESTDTETGTGTGTDAPEA